jgi:hypothetical protein
VPNAVASRIEPVVSGVGHWRLRDERIGGYTNAAHAVTTDGAVTLIDPLPLADVDLERLRPARSSRAPFAFPPGVTVSVHFRSTCGTVRDPPVTFVGVPFDA